MADFFFCKKKKKNLCQAFLSTSKPENFVEISLKLIETLFICLKKIQKKKIERLNKNFEK